MSGKIFCFVTLLNTLKYCYNVVFLFHCFLIITADISVYQNIKLFFPKKITSFTFKPFFELEKRRNLPHFWSDKGIKGTVVKQALPSLHGTTKQHVHALTQKSNSILPITSFKNKLLKMCMSRWVTHEWGFLGEEVFWVIWPNISTLFFWSNFYYQMQPVQN